MTRRILIPVDLRNANLNPLASVGFPAPILEDRSMLQFLGHPPHLPYPIQAIRTLSVASAGAGVLSVVLWLILLLPPSLDRLGPPLALAAALPLLGWGVAAGNNMLRLTLGTFAAIAAVASFATGAWTAQVLIHSDPSLSNDWVAGLTTELVLSLIEAGLVVALARRAFSRQAADWCVQRQAA